MFVSDYARSAIAGIDGQQTNRDLRAEAVNEVWMLPSDCRAVAQLLPRHSGPVDAGQVAAHLHMRAGQDSARFVAGLSRTALNVAEQLGDMRLDTLNIGLSENIDPNHGCLTITSSGQFDSANAARALREHGAALHTVDGVEIFEPDKETTIFFPSDRECIVMFSPGGEHAPVQEMIAAAKTREPPLKRSPKMAAMVRQMLPSASNAAHALWIAVQVSDAYRQLPGLDGFDTVTLVGDQNNGALNLTARGESPDVQTAAAALQQLNRFLAEGEALLKAALPAQPSLQPAIDFLGTVKLQRNERSISATGTFTESPESLYMLPLRIGLTFEGN